MVRIKIILQAELTSCCVFVWQTQFCEWYCTEQGCCLKNSCVGQMTSHFAKKWKGRCLTNSPKAWAVGPNIDQIGKVIKFVVQLRNQIRNWFISDLAQIAALLCDDVFILVLNIKRTCFKWTYGAKYNLYCHYLEAVVFLLLHNTFLPLTSMHWQLCAVNLILFLLQKFWLQRGAEIAEAGCLPPVRVRVGLGVFYQT